MSKWTHAICHDCWNTMNPDRPPFRVREADFVACCFCGDATADGIYTRADPATIKCRGEGEAHP